MMKPAFAKIVTVLSIALILIVNDEVDGRLENANSMKVVKRGFPGPPGGMPPMMGMGGPPQKREVELESDQTQLQFVKRFHPPGGMPMGPVAPPSKRSINDYINNETPFQKRCGGGKGGPPQKRGVDDEEPFVKRCGGGAMGGPPQKREVKEEPKMVKRMSVNRPNIGVQSHLKAWRRRSINDQVNEGKGAEALVKRHAHNAGGPPS